MPSTGPVIGKKPSSPCSGTLQNFPTSAEEWQHCFLNHLQSNPHPQATLGTQSICLPLQRMPMSPPCPKDGRTWTPQPRFYEIWQLVIETENLKAVMNRISRMSVLTAEPWDSWVNITYWKWLRISCISIKSLPIHGFINIEFLFAQYSWQYQVRNLCFILIIRSFVIQSIFMEA